jgi:hypothetical protein
MHLLHNSKLLDIFKRAVTQGGLEPLTSRFCQETCCYGAAPCFMLNRKAFYLALWMRTLSSVVYCVFSNKVYIKTIKLHVMSAWCFNCKLFLIMLRSVVQIKLESQLYKLLKAACHYEASWYVSSFFYTAFTRRAQEMKKSEYTLEQ